VTLPTWHTGLLFHRDAAELIAQFLATGNFPAIVPSVETP
jgi:hypothetical protein